jgi:hypothetical protein
MSRPTYKEHLGGGEPKIVSLGVIEVFLDAM